MGMRRATASGCYHVKRAHACGSENTDKSLLTTTLGGCHNEVDCREWQVVQLFSDFVIFLRRCVSHVVQRFIRRECQILTPLARPEFTHVHRFSGSGRRTA